MTDGQKKLVEQYAVMCNPDEVAFTPSGLESFIKALTAHAYNILSEELWRMRR